MFISHVYMSPPLFRLVILDADGVVERLQWVQGKVWTGLERKKRCDVIIRHWHRGTTQLRRDSEQKIAKICLPVSRIHFLHKHFVRTLPIWIIHAEEPSANRRLHR